MPRSYYQTKAYRNLSSSEVQAISEEDAWKKFAFFRWGSLERMPCPSCGVVDRHYARRTRKQWRCKSCDHCFSVTSGTPFADRKLSFNKLTELIYAFAANHQGKSALEFSADLKVTTRTVFLNFHKLREALLDQEDQSQMKGTVHIDGGFFGGKPHRSRRRHYMTSVIANAKLRNRKASIDPTLDKSKIEPWNAEKSKNRRVVLAIAQESGEKKKGAVRLRAPIVLKENQDNVIDVIRQCVASGSTIYTDDSLAYRRLSKWYDHRVVCHQREYATSDGVNNNLAECFISCMRRTEYGVINGMRPMYFAFYAAETAWRQNSRRKSRRDKFDEVFKKVLSCGLSEAWRGYNQGNRMGFEILG